MSQELHNVACTGCGCVCDDLRVTVSENKIQSFSPPCPVAERWFAQANASDAPLATLHGQPCSLDDAIKHAAELLRTARSPLLYGLAGSSTPGQRAAVELADRLGATIDTSASTCHGPSILALQQVGESTCTLGEIKNRADLVVYWGSNPAKTHPRHMERYALDPCGMFVPGGRKDRTLVVVDKIPTATTAVADIFLQVQPDSSFEILWTLRALLRGLPITAKTVGGIALEVLTDLVQRLRSCKYGVFFFGRGLTLGTNGHASVAALLSLTRELNAVTRFHARRMRVYGDVAGADAVLCWQTGFPFSVNLARGFPRYGPGEYSAPQMLARGETDACLLVGSEGVATFAPAAVATLQRIPTIALDHPHAALPFVPHVRFTTSRYGIHAAGTAYRMDEVPIPLRPLIASPWPTDAEILQRISQQLQS